MQQIYGKGKEIHAMMIPDNYEVNVARKEKKQFDTEERYYHLFRIDINETYPNEKIDEKFDLITKAFPAPEYKCTLTRVECRGYQEREV